MKVWVFFICASGINLFSLVLERYIAAVKPLKYLTFMKRRRVNQMVFTSWGIPFLFTTAKALFSIRLDSFYSHSTIVGYLYLLFEVILCVILIFCLASMLLTVYKQNSRDHSLAKQLRFNHRVVKVQTRNKSAVRWVVLVTCVFLLCYGIFLRCSLLFLTGHKCGHDLYYKLRNRPNSLRFLQKWYKAKMRKASLQKASLINILVVQATQEKLKPMH